ncbi:MAG: Fic family protein [Candidatus Peribacteraceae bacterium]|nr:Fic family protein [Candidatus Peribacteraceae bacterium]
MTNRYDVSGGSEMEFADRAKKVLVNEKGITVLRELQHAEELALSAAYEILLGEVRTDTPMSAELFRHVHERIFGELYVWAGKWRTVYIRKGSTVWPPPDHLEKAMRTFEREVLQRYPAEKLKEDDDFCAAAGQLQGNSLPSTPSGKGTHAPSSSAPTCWPPKRKGPCSSTI